MSKCALCNSQGVLKLENYDTGEKDFNGKNIIVSDFKVYNCSNTSCENAWVSQTELDRVDDEVARGQRIPPTKDDLNIIWQSLGFSTKSSAAKFLNLNSKAFTKWTNGYSEISAAYDLLLRLAVHSVENFKFIQHLHDKNFKFDQKDYQLICNNLGYEWNFKDINVTLDVKSYGKANKVITNQSPAYVESTAGNTNIYVVSSRGEAA